MWMGVFQCFPAMRALLEFRTHGPRLPSYLKGWKLSNRRRGTGTGASALTAAPTCDREPTSHPGGSPAPGSPRPPRHSRQLSAALGC